MEKPFLVHRLCKRTMDHIGPTGKSADGCYRAKTDTREFFLADTS